MIGAAVLGAVLLTSAAVDIDNRPLTEGLLITGAYAMGIVESVSRILGKALLLARDNC